MDVKGSKIGDIKKIKTRQKSRITFVKPNGTGKVSKTKKNKDATNKGGGKNDEKTPVFREKLGALFKERLEHKIILARSLTSLKSQGGIKLRITFGVNIIKATFYFAIWLDAIMIKIDAIWRIPFCNRYPKE